MGVAPSATPRIVFGGAPAATTRMVMGGAPAATTRMVMGDAPAATTRMVMGGTPAATTRMVMGGAPAATTRMVIGGAPAATTRMVMGGAPAAFPRTDKKKYDRPPLPVFEKFLGHEKYFSDATTAVQIAGPSPKNFSDEDNPLRSAISISINSTSDFVRYRDWPSPAKPMSVSHLHFTLNETKIN
jgi:hypothetical protein